MWHDQLFVYSTFPLDADVISEEARDRIGMNFVADFVHLLYAKEIDVAGTTLYVLSYEVNIFLEEDFV